MLCLNCALKKGMDILREGTCLLNSKQGKSAYLSCLSRIHQTAATVVLRVGLRRQTSCSRSLAGWEARVDFITKRD